MENDNLEEWYEVYSTMNLKKRLFPEREEGRNFLEISTVSKEDTESFKKHLQADLQMASGPNK